MFALIVNYLIALPGLVDNWLVRINPHTHTHSHTNTSPHTHTHTHTHTNASPHTHTHSSHTHSDGAVASWSSWGAWSPCSRTCNQGERTRIRTCIGGTTCQGSNIDRERCNTNPCPSESVVIETHIHYQLTAIITYLSHTAKLLYTGNLACSLACV